MDFISLILCTLCFIISFKFISILYYYYIDCQRYKNFPNTHSLPFVGDSYMLGIMTPPELVCWYDSIPYRFKEGIFTVWIGMEPLVVIYKPEYLETILHSTVNIEKGIPYGMLKAWLGNGLLTSTGAQWFHDRRLIGPTFHFTILEQFAVMLSDKTETLIKCLEKEIEKDPEKAIDFFPFAVNVALDIICETAMDVDIRSQESETGYCTDVKRASELTLHRLFRPWLWQDWIYNSIPIGKEYNALLNKLHGFTKEVIDKRKAVRLSRSNDEKSADKLIDSDTDKPKKKVFLDLLLDQNEMDDAPLTDDQLRAQVDTFMFEGHDTTAVAITWTLFCLGNSLEHQEKVHEEIQEVFKDSRAPASVKELSQLKYLERVIKEALRLFPSVPMMTRRLAEDVKLDNYTISEGTTVTLSPYLVQRNPLVWPNPLKFDPDRFLPENSKSRNPYAYIPFSAGPRNCIGQKFAMLEEKTVLTAIMRKWRVESLKTLNAVKYGSSLILRPEEEIPIRFRPKKDN